MKKPIFSVRKYFSGLTVAASSLLYSGTAKAEVVHVDPSWLINFNGTGYSAELINKILDNDPLTRGKEGSGIEDWVAQPGDEIVFDAGTYQLGLGLGNFEARVSGTLAQPIIIRGEGWDDTILRGASISGQNTVWKIYSSHVVMKDFRTENANFGLVIMNQSQYENITFQQIKSIDHSQHYVWPEQNAPAPRSAPDVHFRNTYVMGGNAGFVFTPINGATLNTKYAGVSNATLRNITGLGMQIPVVFGGIETGGCVVLGNDDLHDVVIECEKNCGNFLSSTIPCFNTPSGFDEWNLGSQTLAELNVQPTKGLAQNIEADPMLDSESRPMFSSPAIGQQYSTGYSGAVPPLNRNFDGTIKSNFIFGDIDNNETVNGADIQGFTEVFTNPNYLNDSLEYQRKLFAADINNNNQHDAEDISGLVDLLLN